MSENSTCIFPYNCTTPTTFGSSAALYKTILVIVGGSILTLLTTVGNLLVLISFRINKQLRTVTNYFLLSLAIADFTIGVFSMPIFFTFFEKNHWPFNTLICDVWLSVDYTMSNASVANLLLICFDRYLSITRPLTYRAKRTPKRVSIMIGCAWAISCLIWTPWIWAWPYIDERLPAGKCELPFTSKATVAIPTAIAAFYLPVTLMCLLYFRIYRETVKRRKELHLLQAQHQKSYIQPSSNNRSTKNFSASVVAPMVEQDESISTDSNRSHGRIKSLQNSSVKKLITSTKTQKNQFNQTFPCCWKLRTADQTKSKRNPIPGDDEESSSESHPVTTDRILTDSLSVKTNGKLCPINGRPNTVCDPSDQNKPILYADPWIRRCDQPLSSNYLTDQDQPEQLIQYETRLYYHSLSSTSDEHLAHQRQPLLNNVDKDIEYVESRLRGQTTVSLPVSHSNNYTHDVSWRRHHSPPNFINLSPSPNDQQQQQARPAHQKYPTTTNTQSINETAVPSSKLTTQKSLSPTSTNTNGSVKTVKSRMEKMKDQKAAKTLSAILIAFIVTWLPYNTNIVISIIKPNIFEHGFPMYWERFGYMLCYINSTINPMLYALCNGTFRRTFARILRCQCHQRHTPTHMQKAYRFQSKKTPIAKK